MELRFSIFRGILALAAVLLFSWEERRKWYVHLLTALAGCLFVVLVSEGYIFGVRCLFGLSSWEFAHRFIYRRLTIVTTGQMLALLGAWIVRQIRMGVSFRWIALTLLLPMLSLLMIMVILFIYLGRNDISQSTFFFCCLLELGNVLAVFLIHVTQKRTALNQEMALLNQQLQIQTESISSLEKSYRSQRQATHDYNNQLQTIYRLLSDGNGTAALTLVEQLLEEQSDRIFSVHSGHPIVDAVAHQKCQSARERGITVSFQVNDLSGISMKMNELVVLLSNLLDNAIEGCERWDGERKLECIILLQQGNLFLSVRNTSPEVMIRGRKISTTKQPKAEHGFGLKTICRILDDRKAEYHFRWENGWFEFAAEIPNE